jgi:GT2 family glycosyltransferase
VSIIILAWRHDHHLQKCLKSIATVGSSIPFEVVVLLNGAAAPVTSLVEGTRGLRVVRSNVNLGFAAGCNRARAAARGELLLLLNDDTEVEPGWMEGLVHAIDEDSDAAAVGSRVLFDDGSVQEAGCVIWRDGSTTTVGRGSRDEDGRYNYLRPVHYCSACALLIRASAWDAVGGLDEAYFPGYFEDADFCLRMREQGRKVLYQPASRVRHHESASLDGAYKAFVIRRSRAYFSAKWRDVLSGFLPADAPDAVERAVQLFRGPRHALVIGDRQDGAIELSRSGWAVTLLARGGLDASSLSAAGVEHTTDDLGTHLCAPSRAYDLVIVEGAQLFETAADVIRSKQPATTLVVDLRTIGAQDNSSALAVVRKADAAVTSSLEEAAALRSLGDEGCLLVQDAPNVGLARPSWPRILQEARRHRYGLAREPTSWQ